jgi:hypothetical protein
MKLAVILKLVLLIVLPTLVWLLSRWDHPIAHTLLANIGSSADRVGSSAAQERETARRSLWLGFICTAAAVLIAVSMARFPLPVPVQVGAGVAFIALLVCALVFFVNASRFAAAAFSKRSAEKRLPSQQGPPASLSPR